MKYSVDTSALIDGLERYYPAAHFPKLWIEVDKLLHSGRLLISEEVWREAHKKDAALKDWCDENGMNRNNAIVPTASNPAILVKVGEITTDYPKWVQQGGKNGADPFVIAVAETLNCMVITGEKYGGTGNPKIPFVCDQRKTPHGKFIDIVIGENWVIG